MPDTARVTRWAAVTCVLATVALAACDPPVSPPPTAPPPATTASPYTQSGTALRVGQPAVVPWQDSGPNAPAGALRLSVTEIADGGVGGAAFPDPGAPPGFNDAAFFVHVSVTNAGKVPVHPAGLFGLVTVYDPQGAPMTPATTYDTSCAGGSNDALAPGAATTDCKAYLGSVVAPHVAKVVFASTVPATAITWTNPG